MSCNERDILLYVDGELTPEEAARFRAHAHECASCREALDAALALDRALGDLDDFAPPENFAAVTVTRARCDVTHAVTSPRERRRALTIASALAVVSIALLWPTGVGAAVLQTLAPLRCLSRFLVSWTISSFLGLSIVGRTLSSHLLATSRLEGISALVLLTGILAALGILLARYHRDEVSAGRGPFE